MADALNPAGDIYEGFWTDWSKGSTWGLTWTLCPTSAIILTNSLAVFVTICGARLWTIARYILHQRGAFLQPGASTPHMKQQLVLRNASSALATSRLMLELAWSSRNSMGKPSLRAWSIGLVAMFYAILFMVASIFSNKAVSKASANGASPVLLRSTTCGIWNQTYYDMVENQMYTDHEEFGTFVQYAAKRVHDVQRSLQYAQECYLSQAAFTDTSSSCRTLKKPTVGSVTSGTGLCPFEAQLCHDSADVVVLDTGEIDSHDDLGINARPADRLKYRRITTCAVLNGTSQVRGWNGSIESSSTIESSPETAYAYYGPSFNQKTPWTYSYSNFASFYANFSGEITAPYLVDIEQVRPAYASNDFQPIPELAQENIDLNLIFLSFTGMYLGRVNDPWFSATDERLFDNKMPFLRSRFARDKAISAIGCTEQHRFCTDDGICTGYLGFDQVQNVERFNASLTSKQNVTRDRLTRAIADSRLWMVVKNLQKTTTPLLASNTTFAGNSGAVLSQALPDNQWKRELEYWHAIAMAQLQRAVVQWATGQIAAEPQYLLRPTEPQDIWFCKNMVVPSSLYQSFSVVALILIICFGTIITITSLVIERLETLIRRWFRKSSPRKYWDHDDMLELRRTTTKAGWKPPPLPKDDGYCPASRRQIETNGRRISSTAAFVFNGRRCSSQALPRDDPAFQRVTAHRTSSPTSRPIRPDVSPWPLRDSWMSISLHSLDLAPRVVATSMVDERQSMASPAPVLNARPIVMNENLYGECYRGPRPFP